MDAPSIIVCGFGRCGSSLAMQMLAAGGVPCVGRFPSFEDGRACTTLTARQWHEFGFAGRAVKVLDPQRWPPPPVMRFHGLWLDRDHHQQARSHVKFARAMFGVPAGRNMARRFEASYRRDLPAALAAVAAACAEFQRLSFEDMLERPYMAAVVLSRLAGRPFDVDAAAACVRWRSPECAEGLAELDLTPAGSYGGTWK